MADAPLLDVEGLEVVFPTPQGDVHAVRDVSLRMGREKIGIVGESGSGKSTVARALMGLVRRPGRVAARRMRLGDLDLAGLDEKGYRDIRGRRIAMILQDPKFSLNPVLPVGRQIEEILLLHARMSAADRRARAMAMLADVGIDDPDRVYRAYPHELSGGMGQRAMIAAMLVGSPDLLIADEPTSALDVVIRDQVLALMERLAVERGFGLVIISHDLNMVSRFCDRIVVMYRGRVVETLSAGALERAEHPYTRGLIACLPGIQTRGADLPVLSRLPAWDAAGG
ncbi:MAG: ABC transporter ATP-binding protein [Burkholderiales bacterium]|jgi:peptide/nickel transport system ATP-binding protein|nr:ABC transporter ATP-binding protein [Burkholderiales bacterium]